MTAVEWLVEQINKHWDNKDVNSDELIKQAKEMEKQQIIDAFDEGQEYEYQYHINNTPKFDSQTYFAETYGSKGSDEVLKCTCNVDSFLCQIHGTSDGKTITAF